MLHWRQHPPDRQPAGARDSAATTAFPWIRTLGSGLAALAVCVCVLAAVFDIRPEALKWPFAYRGDTMFYQVVVKSVTEHGWFLNVPLLGAPHSLDLRDVPTSDNNLHILILRLLSLGSSHYPTVLNAFYLLGFVLVFLSAFGVFRYLGVAWWTGVSAALLFAFAPFHIQRGEHHLFLSAYWQVPLAVLLALSTSGVRLEASGSGPTPAWHAGRWARIAAGVGITARTSSAASRDAVTLA